MITLVLGGARSGKSAIAERLVLAHPGPVLYIATGEATDADMARRIDRHRRRRDPRFTTVEAGTDLAGALVGLAPRPALVDALGTWLARHHGPPRPTPAGTDERMADITTEGAADFVVDVDALVAALAARRATGAPTVIVSDEVGSGVHPETAVGRRFRDALGELNQRVAAEADDVHLVVAGRMLALRTPDELGI